MPLVNVVILCCIILFSTNMYGDDRRSAIESVVMLSTDQGGYGSGIIVGEDDRWVYIITAAHVVWNHSAVDIYNVEALFKQVPDQRFPVLLATPVNRKAISATPASVDLSSDFAVLKVDKNNLPQKIVMPTVGRRYDNEEINKVQFVGRKSIQQQWRGTPLFEVLPSSELVSTKAHQLVAQSFFQLSGYSGGGIFDEQWRLVGMTIKGGVQSENFSEDELTAGINITWIIEKLKGLAIPLAPYLGGFEEGPLSLEIATSQMPHVILQVLPDHYQYKREDQVKLRVQYKKGIYTLPQKGTSKLYLRAFTINGNLKNITIQVFVSTEKNVWAKLDEKTFDIDYGGVGARNEWIVQKEIKNIFMCYSAPLKKGGYGVASVSYSGIELPIKGYNYINMEHAGYKQTRPVYSIRSRPCEKIIEKAGIHVK